MRKYGFILLLVLFLVWLGLSSLFLGEWFSALTASSPQGFLVLDEGLVKTIMGEVQGNVGQAKKEAVKETLKALGLSPWESLPKFNSFILWGNILPAAGEELVLAFSDGQDQGAVAVFQKGEEGYELAEVIKGLVPITHVAFLGLEGYPLKALIIDEYLDEMTGAFYKVKTKAVYLYKGQGLAKIWERERYRKEHFPEGGELKGPDTYWLMGKEEAAIVFSPQGHITVTGIRTQGKNLERGQVAGQYEILNREKFKEIYLWDAQSLSYKRQNHEEENH